MDTPRGTAWIDDRGADIYGVYRDEEGRELLGSIVVVARAIDEVTYTWSAGEGEGGPNGVELSESAAVIAILGATA